MKNKKINYTKQGYSYIKCSMEECINWGGAAICDDCGEIMTDDIYLIYILNRAYCPNCFNEWKDRAKRYEEDIRLQDENDEKYYNAYGFKII